MELMEHSDQQRDAVEWLRGEYLRRRARNPAYSMRAFARALQIPSGRVSELLGRKRTLTPALAERIARQLAYTPEQRRSFFSLIEREMSLHNRVRQMRFEALDDEHYEHLTEDVFQAIADWTHYAILSLMNTVDFRSSPQWIARRLDITPSEVCSALERLERLHLIQRDGKEWRRSHRRLTTTHNIESAALRRSHQQTLNQAMDAIENVPIAMKDTTAMTMAVDVSKIKLAKELIKSFRRNLADILEEGHPTEVFNLSILLFPLTKRNKQ